jgi:hypothetical protein
MCNHKDSPTPNEFKSEPSADSMTATAFLLSETTVIADFYTSLVKEYVGHSMPK